MLILQQSSAVHKETTSQKSRPGTGLPNGLGDRRGASHPATAKASPAASELVAESGPAASPAAAATTTVAAAASATVSLTVLCVSEAAATQHGPEAIAKGKAGGVSGTFSDAADVVQG
jgi:hypothetical protein